MDQQRSSYFFVPIATVLVMLALTVVTEGQTPGQGTTGQNSPVQFDPGPTLGITAPQALLSEDLNCDGHADLAVTSTLVGKIQIFFGNGMGGFPSSTFCAVDSPYHLATADFDNNGEPDLAATSILDSKVTVVLRSLTGVYTISAEIPTGATPTSLAVGDFNEDTHPDIAVTNHGTGTITICFGSGTGTFPTQTSLAYFLSPSFVVVADFNRDTHMDMVVSSSLDSNFRVFHGTGTGSFVGPTVFNTGINDTVWFMHAHDVNEDSYPDVVAPCPFNDAVAILTTNPFGSFSSVQVMPTGQHPQWTISADMDQDSHADLVTANSVSDNVSVNLASSTGFQAPALIPAGANCVAVAAQDFDEDGRIDMAVSNLFGNSIDVFLNRSGFAAGNFRRGDVDGDGQVLIGDAVLVLSALFGSPPVTTACADASDTNDDGVVNIADGITLLSYLFGGGPAPAFPFATCGQDFTVDNLVPCTQMVVCP